MYKSKLSMAVLLATTLALGCGDAFKPVSLSEEKLEGKSATTEKPDKNNQGDSNTNPDSQTDPNAGSGFDTNTDPDPQTDPNTGSGTDGNDPDPLGGEGTDNSGGEGTDNSGNGASQSDEPATPAPGTNFAPDFALTDMNPESKWHNKSYGIEAFHGKLVVMAAHQGSCGICRATAEQMGILQKEFEAENVDIQFTILHAWYADQQSYRDKMIYTWDPFAGTWKLDANGNKVPMYDFPLLQDNTSIFATKKLDGTGKDVRKDDLIVFGVDGKFIKKITGGTIRSNNRAQYKQQFIDLLNQSKGGGNQNPDPDPNMQDPDPDPNMQNPDPDPNQNGGGGVAQGTGHFPQFSLQDLNPESGDFNQSYGLEKFKGSVVVMAAHQGSCGICRVTAAEMGKMEKEFAQEGKPIKFAILHAWYADSQGNRDKMVYTWDPFAGTWKLDANGNKIPMYNFPLFQDKSGVFVTKKLDGTGRDVRKDDLMVFNQNGEFVEKITGGTIRSYNYAEYKQRFLNYLK